MNFKQVSWVSALLFAFFSIFYSNSSFASEKKTGAVQKNYPQNFASNFLKECISRASTNKEAADFLPPARVKELCECTLHQFQTKYTHAQYQALSIEAKEREGYACLEKILYGE